MLTQKDFDKISSIKQQDFITILTAVEGGVDWEQMIILYANYEYHKALNLLQGGWTEAVDKHKDKADKAMDYLNTFKRMNLQ